MWFKYILLLVLVQVVGSVIIIVVVGGNIIGIMYSDIVGGDDNVGVGIIMSGVEFSLGVSLSLSLSTSWWTAT